jgi:hypothetical protein
MAAGLVPALFFGRNQWKSGGFSRPLKSGLHGKSQMADGRWQN